MSINPDNLVRSVQYTLHTKIIFIQGPEIIKKPETTNELN